MDNAAAAALIERGMAVIAKPDRWCKDMLRRSRFARRQQYCGIGSIWCALREPHSMIMDQAIGALHEAAHARGCLNFEEFNDAYDTTHADVLACMREAVEWLKTTSTIPHA